ncbi:MAG: hypothetical protein ABI222_06115 [Opitutaceae bacterium]
MLTLTQNSLAVELLNPADSADRARMGTRFCWGGYIWQVHDQHAGPLLTGPDWPDAPTPFNGQGLPESFRHAELGTNKPLILENGRGFILGIGEVAPGNDDEPVVTKPCQWSVTRSAAAIDFYTVQAGGQYGARLSRRIALEGRSLTSFTKIINTGTRPLPVHWFAHPFFALTDGVLTCGLPRSWDMVENPGYVFDAERRIAFKRVFKNKLDGHFQPLIVGPKTPLRASLSHPRLSKIFFSTDFTPDSCPIWGNSTTWSIEPYITIALAPGATRSWTLTYEFGVAT